MSRAAELNESSKRSLLATAVQAVFARYSSSEKPPDSGFSDIRTLIQMHFRFRSFVVFRQKGPFP